MLNNELLEKARKELAEEELPTSVVVVPHPKPDQVMAALRRGKPPIVARVSGGAVRVDPRTLLPGEGEIVAARLAALL